MKTILTALSINPFSLLVLIVLAGSLHVLAVSPSNAPTENASSSGASSKPTTGLTPNEIEYEPGNLVVYENNMYLSEGLTSRVIAISGSPVTYSNGQQSIVDFHGKPDGAAIFLDERPGIDNPGGYVYVSNSEVGGSREGDAAEGGVGAIYFDKHGNVLEYKMLLTGSRRNCNGGKTLWNSYISCEEIEGGIAWQVDPQGVRDPEPIAHGMQGGRWESFAHDTRDPNNLYAFLSEDSPHGALQRMTLANPDYSDDNWNILLSNGPIDYLFVEPDKSWLGFDEDFGTFSWITDEAKARENAKNNYSGAEGLEMVGNELWLVSKTFRGFYRLDLDSQTYTFEETTFCGDPDQTTTVQQEDGSLLSYFSVERPCKNLGLKSGIYSRNEQNEYVHILHGVRYSEETTGIAFSPDGKRMYFCYQDEGYMIEVRRTDDLSFHDRKAPSPVSGLFSRAASNAYCNVLSRLKRVVEPWFS